MSRTLQMVLEPVRCPTPFEAFRSVGLKFPLTGTQADLVRELCVGLLRSCATAGLGEPTTWLDSRPMHLDGGSKLYSQHGAAWGSRWGFGFDPSARPPRKIEFEDFLNLKFGEEMRIDQRSNFFVRDVAQSLKAYEVMSGRGLCTFLSFADKDRSAAAERYMKHTRDVLYQYFPTGEFGSYRYYLPLLSSTAVTSADATHVAEWMGEATVYLREAYDTGELLLLTAQPSRALLQAAGLRALAMAEDTPWEFLLTGERAYE